MKRPHVRGDVIVSALLGFVFVVFVWAVALANHHGDQRIALNERTQQDNAVQINALREQLSQLATDVANSRADAERAKAQANTSVGQLVESGIKPIVAAPGVVTVPTTPEPTTTTTSGPPRVPEPTTSPPTTVPTSETTTTTQAPTAPEPVPETTTTTAEPDTTTTTVEETTTTTIGETP